MISTPRTASLVIAPAFAVLAAASCLSAGEVAATKDGITITAEASPGLPGKTRISCTLTNHSPHTLASLYRSSPCLCFQFKLLDAKGNRVPQERDWSVEHYQDEPNLPENEKIRINEILIAPSESEDFHFDLEDAYGARTAQGRT